MKTLINVSVLAAVLFLGACSSISHPHNVGATEAEMYGSSQDNSFDNTRD
ncbi:hypothetical protein PT286_09770 [Neisseriaceae bacterium ESL0693]|nr:hypothetical protein [Neisseriaceae bacterium ESL0693]